MRPTRILCEEHRAIGAVLDCLEKLADDAATAGRLECGSAGEVLEFVRDFAARCHHGKEEQILFPFLERRGCVPDAGPAALLKEEHAVEDSLVRALEDAHAAAGAGDPAAPASFVRAARAYLWTFREHMLREEACLFPLADERLRPEDEKEILADFARADARTLGPGARERYLMAAGRLSARIGATPPAAVRLPL